MAQLKPIPAIHGIGSRVRLIARAIASDPFPEIDWAIGPECPCGHREVFPNGIPGVILSDSPQGDRIGFLWRTSADDGKFPEAIQRIFSSMELPAVERLDLGILFRGHFWKGLTPTEFAPAIESAMLETAGPVATICDSRRAEIFATIGPRAIPQESAEPAFDLDRKPEDVRLFLFEWWRLLNCRRVVSNFAGTSLLWPMKWLG